MQTDFGETAAVVIRESMRWQHCLNVIQQTKPGVYSTFRGSRLSGLSARRAAQRRRAAFNRKAYMTLAYAH